MSKEVIDIVEVTTKKCPTCNTIKSLDEFHYSKKESHNRDWQCKKCKREEYLKSKKYLKIICNYCNSTRTINSSDRLINSYIKRGAIKEGDNLIFNCRVCSNKNSKNNIKRMNDKKELYDKGLKKCGTCKQIKKLEEFNKCDIYNDKLNYRCRECSKICQDNLVQRLGKAILTCDICNKTREVDQKTVNNYKKQGILIGDNKFTCQYCSLTKNKSVESYIESAKKSIYNNYKSKCKNRDWTFELPYDKFLEMIFKDCYYCGSKPSNKKIVLYHEKTKDCNIYTNGIDRIDSTKGYELNNIVTCCSRCNSSKMDYTKEEYIEWIKKAYNNLIANNIQ